MADPDLDEMGPVDHFVSAAGPPNLTGETGVVVWENAWAAPFASATRGRVVGPGLAMGATYVGASGQVRVDLLRSLALRGGRKDGAVR